MKPRSSTPRHIQLKWQKLNTENLKSSKRKANSYIQGKAHMAISLFFRNFADQKGVATYIQRAERKKTLQLRILYPARLSFRMERENREFTRQTS